MSNTEKFFSLYNSDSEVRSKVASALELYPGSLEIRESVVEDVLLPIAAEYGLPFTLQDLRTYETEKKLQNRKPDIAAHEGDPIEDPEEYWLLDRGWEWVPDEAQNGAI